MLSVGSILPTYEESYNQIKRKIIFEDNFGDRFKTKRRKIAKNRHFESNKYSWFKHYLATKLHKHQTHKSNSKAFEGRGRIKGIVTTIMPRKLAKTSENYDYSESCTPTKTNYGNSDNSFENNFVNREASGTRSSTEIYSVFIKGESHDNKYSNVGNISSYKQDVHLPFKILFGNIEVNRSVNFQMQSFTNNRSLNLKRKRSNHNEIDDDKFNLGSPKIMLTSYLRCKKLKRDATKCVLWKANGKCSDGNLNELNKEKGKEYSTIDCVVKTSEITSVREFQDKAVESEIKEKSKESESEENDLKEKNLFNKSVSLKKQATDIKESEKVDAVLSSFEIISDSETDGHNETLNSKYKKLDGKIKKNLNMTEFGESEKCDFEKIQKEFHEEIMSHNSLQSVNTYKSYFSHKEAVPYSSNDVIKSETVANLMQIHNKKILNAKRMDIYKYEKQIRCKNDPLELSSIQKENKRGTNELQPENNSDTLSIDLHGEFHQDSFLCNDEKDVLTQEKNPKSNRFTDVIHLTSSTNSTTLESFYKKAKSDFPWKNKFVTKPLIVKTVEEAIPLCDGENVLFYEESKKEKFPVPDSVKGIKTCRENMIIKDDLPEENEIFGSILDINVDKNKDLNLNDDSRSLLTDNKTRGLIPKTNKQKFKTFKIYEKKDISCQTDVSSKFLPAESSNDLPETCPENSKYCFQNTSSKFSPTICDDQERGKKAPLKNSQENNPCRIIVDCDSSSGDEFEDAMHPKDSEHVVPRDKGYTNSKRSVVRLGLSRKRKAEPLHPYLKRNATWLY